MLLLFLLSAPPKGMMLRFVQGRFGQVQAKLQKMNNQVLGQRFFSWSYLSVIRACEVCQALSLELSENYAGAACFFGVFSAELLPLDLISFDRRDFRRAALFL